MEPQRERPAPVSTGDPRVDAAVEELASIEDMDLADRAAVLDGVHDRLREILGELGDPRPGEPGQRGEQRQLPPGTAPRL